MSALEQLNLETLPDRILGMQRLEALFKQQGYLICQSSGKIIYNFDEVATIFIPLSPSVDQVMAVHSEHAKSFIRKVYRTSVFTDIDKIP